jgi:hypothetical protein
VKSDAKRYVNCVVRKCALRSGMNTCASCSKYPCDELKQRTPGDGWAKRILDKFPDIPKQDYRDCVEPYLGLRNLDAVRKRLRKKDAREPLPFKVNPQVREFPGGKMPARTANLALHGLVTAIRRMPADTWAKHLALRKHKENMLRLLWTFGLHGRLKRKPAPHLEIRAEDFRDGRNLTHRATLEQVTVPLLRKAGATVKLVVLDRERWLTPTGAIRGEGMLMRLTLTAKAGGPPGLKALRTWCRALDRKHKRKGLAFFSTADMRILARKS